MRHPILFNRNNFLNRLHKILHRQARQAHAVIGVNHALRIFVRPEQLDRTIGRAVGFHALERLHRVMQDHGCRIDLKRLIRYDTRVVPALLLIVVDDQHVIGIIDAEAEAVFIRLGLFVGCELFFDLQHGGFTLSICFFFYYSTLPR